jgi:hypothetical protein
MFTTVSATDASLAALLAIGGAGLWVAAFIAAAKVGQASAAKWWEKKLHTVPIQAGLGSPKDL